MTTLNTNINASPDTLLSAQDPLIDMTFITTFTGMTDKWFFKLIGDGLFRNPSSWGAAPAGAEARWKPGCSSVLLIPVASEQGGYLNGKTTPHSATGHPGSLDVSPLPATVLWRQTLSRLFQTHRRTCTTVTFLYSGADHQPYRPANA